MKAIAFYNLGVEFEYLGDMRRSIDAYKRSHITAKEHVNLNSMLV
jgi:hypothetical protein